MNENTGISKPVNMVEINVVIDAPPGAPRPDVYMKDICKDVLHQEYKDPEYTFMGEWGWKYKVPSKEFKEMQTKAMEYLTKVYNSGQIRYGEFSKKGNVL